MRHFPAVVALSLAFAFAGTANAGIVAGNLGGSGTNALASGSQFFSSTSWIAQGFSVPSGSGVDDQLVSVSVGLSAPVGDGSATASLYSGTSQPTGTALVTDTVAVSGTTAALYTFNLGQQLSGGTNYWIVLSGASFLGWNQNDALAAPITQNSSGWGFIDSLTSSNSGSSWTTGGGSTDASAISVTAVPEPSSLALAGLGILAAGFVSRKRLVG